MLFCMICFRNRRWRIAGLSKWERAQGASLLTTAGFSRSTLSTYFASEPPLTTKEKAALAQGRI
jgi:hypothetical protein